MARRPIRIGDRLFPTKKQAEQACRDVLYAYHPGSTVTIESDHALLVDLLMNHPDREEKIGSGIAWFEVRANPMYPRQRGFWLIRTDGSETDFSFLKCLAPSTHRQDVRSAMRKAIAPQTMTIAREAFKSGEPVRCPITGELMWNMSESHVDHYDPTFFDLSEEFALSEGGWDSISIVSEDGMIGCRFVGTEQRDRWIGHHDSRARLRVVSIRANLSLLRTRSA